MADTATNSGLTLHQITNVNRCLASTTTKQYSTITKLLLDIKLQSASLGTGDSAREQTTPDQKIRTIKPSKRPSKTTGPSAGSAQPMAGLLGSTTPTVPEKTMGTDTSIDGTRDKPAGPGATKNKGWDDFT